MSAGAFLDAFYKTNFGETIRIKIQPETAALVVQGNTNTIPSGANATNEYANVSSRRRRGVNARKVGVRFVGNPPAGYKPGSTIYLPWLNPDTFPDPRGDKSATYLQSAAEFVGVSPERVVG
jgi:hypothetical protein